MLLFRTLSVVTFAALAGAAAAAGGAAGTAKALAVGNFRQLVAEGVFKHHLRLCNAYPHEAALHVVRERSSRKQLTGTRGLGYKECRDVRVPLQVGDVLDFLVADTTAGSFRVSEVPENNAVLLLVIKRVSQSTTAVAFESHVFAGLLNAQVAVIDTFCKRSKASVQIVDPEEHWKRARSEELQLNSVVPVNPGIYEVVLRDKSGTIKAASRLVALNRNSYVVLRTGCLPEKGGAAYPEELVVFPLSDRLALRSRAGSPGVPRSAAWLLSALAALWAAR